MNLIGANVVAKIKAVHESLENDGHVSDVDPDLVKYMRKLFECDGDVVKRLNEYLPNGVTVSGVQEGCIEITFTCKTVESFSNFRALYDSGELENILNKVAFSSHKQEGNISRHVRLHFEGIKSLSVVISDKVFVKCAKKFARWIPMTCEHREALLSSEKWLVDKMTVSDDFLDKLSLCERRRQAIERAATPEQQVNTMLDIISRQPDSAFAQFVDALKATNQYEASAIISRDSTIVTKSEAPRLYKTHTEDMLKTPSRRQISELPSNITYFF